MTPDRLTRVREGKIIAGVCTGLGRRTGIDPLVYRVVLGLLVFTTWSAVPLYVAAAVLMAKDEGGPSPVEQATHRRFDGGALLALLGLLFVTALVLGIAGEGLVGGPDGDALIMLTIIGLLLLVVSSRKVDLMDIAKTLPDRLLGTPAPQEPVTVPSRQEPVHVGTAAVAPERLQQGWIDLATLGSDGTLPPLPVMAPPAPKPGCGPARTPKARAPRSLLTPVTLLAAVVTAAAMVPVSVGYPPVQGTQIVMTTALAVIALGLVAGTWFGRPRGLVAVGALLSLSLFTTSAVGEVPSGSRFGDVHWRPVDPNSAQTYRLVAGDGVLDLSAMSLAEGQTVRVDAELGLGGLRIILPATAKVNVHLSVGLGDVTLDGHITSGPRARVDKALPGFGPNPPTVELHVKGRVGDLEVTRAKP